MENFKIETPPPVPTPEELEIEREQFERMMEEKLYAPYREIYDKLTPETQENWYYTEMEYMTSADRQQAETHLQELIAELEKIKSGV